MGEYRGRLIRGIVIADAGKITVNSMFSVMQCIDQQRGREINLDVTGRRIKLRLQRTGYGVEVSVDNEETTMQRTVVSSVAEEIASRKLWNKLRQFKREHHGSLDVQQRALMVRR